MTHKIRDCRAKPTMHRTAPSPPKYQPEARTQWTGAKQESGADDSAMARGTGTDGTYGHSEKPRQVKKETRNAE